MSRTLSTMLPLGTHAPDFSLPDPQGITHSLADYADARALLVMFICNHCPYVKLVKEEISKLAKDYADRGLQVVAIMSNDVDNYPDDAPEHMATDVVEFDYIFPYLHDATQEVAQAYHAACTPDFFLFDGEQQLAYRGQLDDARPKNGITPTGKDLRAAIDALLSGRPVSQDQIPSLGCNIKWKPGNEPAYYTTPE